MNNKQEISVGQRVSQLIQALGLSKNAFALSLDKTATVIQHIVDERNKPGFDLLCKIFDVYPNVSKDWLLMGIGPMYNNGEQAPDSPSNVGASEVAAVASTSETAPVVQVNSTQTAPAVESVEQLASAQAAPPVVDVPATSAASIPQLSAALPPPVVAERPAAAWEAALYAQQLQHQLALAEMRNQHLLEQQKMLQQMVELMRQR